MNWIGGGHANRPFLTGNLCGILEVHPRLEYLRTRFQYHLQMMDPANPLRIVLHLFSHCNSKCQLTTHLQWDDLYATFLSNTVFTPTGHDLTNERAKLTKFLRKYKREIIVGKYDKTAPLIKIVDGSARIYQSDYDGVLGSYIYFFPPISYPIVHFYYPLIYALIFPTHI